MTETKTLEKFEGLNGEIAPGDYVAWPVRQGNTSEIRTGIVQEVVDTGRTRSAWSVIDGMRKPEPIVRVKVELVRASGHYAVPKPGHMIYLERHDRILRIS